MPDIPQPEYFLTLENNGDPTQVRVAYHVRGKMVASTDVDLGPNPTWPTPAEMNDLMVEGVREVLDAAYFTMTGNAVER